MSKFKPFYKNTFKNTGEMRRRLVEEGVQLRKQKRQEQIAKCRKLGPGVVSSSSLSPSPMEIDYPEGPSCSNQQDFSNTVPPPDPSSFGSFFPTAMLQQLYSDIESEQVMALKNFRALISQNRDPPVAEIVEQGLVPRFVSFLSNNSNPLLQFEATWILTNIAAGTSEQTQKVVEANAIPPLMGLLFSPHNEIIETAVWALGNIAGDSKTFSQQLLTAGIVPLLLHLMDHGPLGTVQNAVRTVFNLCREAGSDESPQLFRCLPSLVRALNSSDGETLKFALWAIAYLIDTEIKKIQMVIQTGVCPDLVKFLQHPDNEVITGALRAVGNIVAGNDAQTQVVLDCNVLPALAQLMKSNVDHHRKEACWILSNITAGTKDQVQAVIDTNIFPIVIDLMRFESFAIQKEAIWMISNATWTGNAEQIDYLVRIGCIPQILKFLNIEDVEILKVALNTLQNILKIGDQIATQSNPYASLIEECDGLDKIESLQLHENGAIYEQSSSIIATYFGSDDENLDIATANQNFSFFQF